MVTDQQEFKKDVDVEPLEQVIGPNPRSLILKLGFHCSYFYYLINPGKTAYSNAARLPPISH